MQTLKLIEYLTQIFLDVALPCVVLWVAYLIRSWLPKEASTHRELTKLTETLDTALRAWTAAQAPPTKQP